MQFEESDTRGRSTIGWRRRFLSPSLGYRATQADAIRYPRGQLT